MVVDSSSCSAFQDNDGYGDSDNNNNNKNSNDNNRIQRCNLRFFTTSSLCHELSPTYAQVALAQSCANHVQLIKFLSRATCVTCHVVRRDSSAIKFDRA